MPVSFEEAARFFDQLRVFSERYLAQINCPGESPWGRPKFVGGKPRGAVFHFTEGEDLDRTLKWFTRPDYGSKASAHVVVARGWTPAARALARDLPLIFELPSLVVQCRRPSQAAAHATWANGTTYGIELVNPGPVAAGVAAWGRQWLPYTAVQVHAAVGLLRRLQALYQDSLRAPWILGHEQVQGIWTKWSSGRDKRDPGPLFPLEDARLSVLEDGPLRYWIDSVDQQPQYAARVMDNWRTAWEADHGPLTAALSAGWAAGGGPFGSQGKLLLRILGYYVVEVATEELHPDDLESVWLFQRMAGLPADRKPGPRTRGALVARLADRGYFPENQ